MSHVPLRTRITALVMVAVGVSVALASVAAWVTVRNQILSQMDNTLSLGARTTADTIHDQNRDYALKGVTPDVKTVSVLDALVTEFRLDGQVVNLSGSGPSLVQPTK